jgi:uncharacterized OsmC-like protein
MARLVRSRWPHPKPGERRLKITLLSEERIRIEGTEGPLAIESASPDQSYSPFHMLAGALATCVYSVLHSWAVSSELPFQDLVVEVGWRFTESPYRVGSFEVDLGWPSLPSDRRRAAERAAHLCTVHQTLLHPPEIRTALTS